MLRMRDAVIAATLLLVAVLVAALMPARETPPLATQPLAVASTLEAPAPRAPALVDRPQLAPPAESPRAVVAEAAPVATVEGNFTGNVRTHKFHRRSCRYSGCPNCTARFATREDALAAGFQPCGTCDP